MSATMTVNGTADNDTALVIGTSCPLTENGGGATTWAWTFKSVPENSARVNADITTPTAQTASFTPDVQGSYLLKCATDDGNVTGVGAVLSSAYGFRIPAALEETEFGTEGWSPDANDCLQKLDDGDRQWMHVTVGASNLVAEEMVYLSTPSGDLPLANKIDSDDYYKKPVAIATKSISATDKGHLMTRGYLTGLTTTGLTNGCPLYCSSTGTLTVTPTKFPVGVYLASGVAWFNFDGAHDYIAHEETIDIGDFFDAINPPDLIETLISGNGAVTVRKFSAVTSEDVVIPIEVPEKAISVAGFRFEVHGVISNTAPAGTVGVSFQGSAYCVGEGDAINGTFSSDVESKKTDLDATYLQYDKWKTTLSTQIIPTNNFTPGELMFFKVYRKHDDTDDTYTQDIGITKVVLHWVERQ